MKNFAKNPHFFERVTSLKIQIILFEIPDNFIEILHNLIAGLTDTHTEIFIVDSKLLFLYTSIIDLSKKDRRRS